MSEVRFCHGISTRSTAKMEEHLALLIAKMDEQKEQLQLLTRQQSERVDEVAKRQEETYEQMQVLAGDLSSKRYSAWATGRGGRSCFQYETGTN